MKVKWKKIIYDEANKILSIQNEKISKAFLPKITCNMFLQLIAGPFRCPLHWAFGTTVSSLSWGPQWSVSFAPIGNCMSIWWTDFLTSGLLFFVINPFAFIGFVKAQTIVYLSKFIFGSFFHPFLWFLSRVY